MMSAIPSKTEKCKGAMLASAIGDALGWPNEVRAKNTARNSDIKNTFIEWNRRCGRPNWHSERILPGEYSDDTQMILCVARSIIAEDWETIFCKNELPYWLRYERGGGGALLRAAKEYEKGNVAWKSGYKKKYFDAGGNGAVMRILPHVIRCTDGGGLEELMRDVVRDCIITHGHPRAILGATCYAYALYYLLNKDTVLAYGELVDVVLDGEKVWGRIPEDASLDEWREAAKSCAGYGYSDEWNRTRNGMLDQLNYIKDSLKKGLLIEDNKVLTKLECFSKVNGAGDVAVLTAIYLASKYANNPVMGIRIPAFSFGGDTDTIASIAGGLLGMLSGSEWIPAEWRLVQDYDCIIQVTELLLSEKMREATKELVSAMKTKYNDWISTPIGKMRFIDDEILESGKNVIVKISKWQSILGQTFYFKKYIKRSDVIKKGNDKKREEDRRVTQCILTSDSINKLLEKPELQKITFKKVLRVLNALLLGTDSGEDIAKKLNVDISVVETLRKQLK